MNAAKDEVLSRDPVGNIIIETHFGVKCDAINEQWPVAGVADIFQNYLIDIKSQNLKAGPKRRATGPRKTTHKMLRQIYGMVHGLTGTKSGQIVYSILKAAKSELEFRGHKSDLLDNKKLSAWASACESLLNKGVLPSDFFEFLEKYRGLEGLRNARIEGLGQ